MEMGSPEAQTPPTRSPLSADPSVGAPKNITTTCVHPCRYLAGRLQKHKPRRSVGGAFLYLRGYEAFWPQKPKGRKNLRGILKGPGPQARSLKAAFFPRVSLQKQRNPEKILINDLTKLHSNTSCQKTYFILHPATNESQAPPKHQRNPAYSWQRLPRP